jgi:uncharacterized protein (DUF2141 family)
MSSILFNILSIVLYLSFLQHSGEIDLQVQGAKSDKGVVRVLVFDSKKGYPDQVQLALRSFSTPLSERKCKIKISDLKPGKYSIAVFHDEDENGSINTNPFGYPIEKYGFSNNAKAYFGPPDYEKTVFELKDIRKAIVINLR